MAAASCPISSECCSSHSPGSTTAPGHSLPWHRPLSCSSQAPGCVPCCPFGPILSCLTKPNSKPGALGLTHGTAPHLHPVSTIVFGMAYSPEFQKTGIKYANKEKLKSAQKVNDCCQLLCLGFSSNRSTCPAQVSVSEKGCSTSANQPITKHYQ